MRKSNADGVYRKALLCAIAKNDMDGARSVFHAMTESTQKEPKTMYLMYKVATRSSDPVLASQCLERVSLAAENLDYLYACVIDSQQAGDKACAVEALTKLLEKYEYTSPNPVHLPALLRCTIRLLKSVLDKDGNAYKDSDGVQHLCNLFDTGKQAPGDHLLGRALSFSLSSNVSCSRFRNRPGTARRERQKALYYR